MYSYAVRHWSRPASVDILNGLNHTPLTLAAKLGRKDIFDEMLELMKVEFWRFSDMACSAYPLTALDTIQPDGTTSKGKIAEALKKPDETKRKRKTFHFQVAFAFSGLRENFEKLRSDFLHVFAG